MKRRLISVLLCSCLLFTCAIIPASAATSVRVTLPAFNVMLNGQVVDNAYSQYPLIVYNDITYFPMTYNDCSFLGVATEWVDSTSGLFIKASGEQGVYKPYTQSTKNASSYIASIVEFPVTVNGKAIDNSKETYPLLLFRDVTYFPMTWRFCVDEFGWNYEFTNEEGLIVSANGKGHSEELNFFEQKAIGEYIGKLENGKNIVVNLNQDRTVVLSVNNGEMITNGTWRINSDISEKDLTDFNFLNVEDKPIQIKGEIAELAKYYDQVNNISTPLYATLSKAGYVQLTYVGKGSNGLANGMIDMNKIEKYHITAAHPGFMQLNLVELKHEPAVDAFESEKIQCKWYVGPEYSEYGDRIINLAGLYDDSGNSILENILSSGKIEYTYDLGTYYYTIEDEKVVIGELIDKKTGYGGSISTVSGSAAGVRFIDSILSLYVQTTFEDGIVYNWPSNVKFISGEIDVYLAK